MKTLAWDSLSKKSEGLPKMDGVDYGGIKTETMDTHSELLNVLRNALISEMSLCVLKDDPGFMSSQVSQDRQAVVEEVLHRYLDLNEAEKLMFFLMMPSPVDKTIVQLAAAKSTHFVTRAEIRQTAAWIRTHLEEDRDVSIPKRDVYDQYLKYCQASKLNSISTADFGKVMKQVYPNVRPRRLGTRGNSQYCYAGMRSSFKVERPDLYATPYHEKGCEQEMESKINPEDTSITMEEDELFTFGEELVNIKQESPSGTHFESFPTGECYSGACSDNELSNCAKHPTQRQILLCSKQDFIPSEVSSKGKVRKGILCHKLKKYINITPITNSDETDGSSEQLNAMDYQIEEELAQYFQDTEETFIKPKKVYSREDRSSSNPSLHRSQSCSGVGFDSNNDNSSIRRNSTVDFYSPYAQSTVPGQSIHSADSFNEDNPSSCNSANPNDPQNFPNLQMLLQRPASEFVDNSTPCYDSDHRPKSSNDQNFRFTPIPLGKKKYPRIKSSTGSHELAGHMSANTRPRSYSTTGVRCGFKRKFTNAFIKPKSGVPPVKDVWSPDICAPNPRSQSLPYFLDSSQNPPLNDSFINENISNIFSDSFTDLTNEELTEVFESTEKPDTVIPTRENHGDTYFENSNQQFLSAFGEVIPAGKQMETDVILSKDDSIEHEQPTEGDLLSQMFALWPEPCLRSACEPFPAINENPVL